MRDFRKLEVWGLGIDFVTKIYKISEGFPSKEQFGISAQIRRAAVSIPSNLAEGCSRRTETEFNRFIEIAIGSSFEVETQLIVSRNLNFLSEESYSEILQSLQLLQRKMQALRSSILPRQ